jgi:radical SAM superfamily enzyme YgiQ (UPF0313 family)
MKILLVYPKHPETFWSYKHALKFVSKKAALPPLGLLTVAAMLPADWEKKVVDLNVKRLRDSDLLWADYVFISAMAVQRNSVKEILARCRALEVKTVAGGPLFTSASADFPEVDHLVLNEAEVTLPGFLADLERGTLRRVYTSPDKADLAETPFPDWSLLDLGKYASMSLQYSRGCPFNCDFCDITSLYGQRTRIKGAAQVVSELDRLYTAGWRGSVFFVDDNFIGNKQVLKTVLLPAVSEWMARHRHPFSFYTQASVNLADDEALMAQMTQAGFDMVFIGIESPNEESLNECLKSQNRNRDLIESVKRCQRAGLQVQGGFIVGFDNDPLSIFESHIAFIQKSGIVTAMVGLLNAAQGTRLHQRLKGENRLLTHMTGDNTDCSINFVPKMNVDALIAGYKRIVSRIYSPSHYYDRVIRFLKDFRPAPVKSVNLKFSSLAALFKSVFVLGLFGKERLHYWRLVFWSLFRRPSLFPLAINLAIHGFHYRKVFEKFC